jgi:uncharacterized small protein (DUF1192 family)
MTTMTMMMTHACYPTIKHRPRSTRGTRDPARLLIPRAYSGGMPGPSKDLNDASSSDSEQVIAALRREIDTLKAELATERTAKGMLESQLRAAVSEVSKILAAKRDLEFELRDRDERGVADRTNE